MDYVRRHSTKLLWKLKMTTKALTINPIYRMQYEKAQESHVLLYPEGMIKLSETAATILEKLDGKSNQETIIQKLVEEYDNEAIGEDFQAFIQQGILGGWILEL